MNFLDFFILIIGLLIVFSGYKRGLIGQVFSISSFILSFYLAGVFYQLFIPWLKAFSVTGYFTSSVIAYILAFIVIILLLKVVYELLKRLINNSSFNIVNKILGAVLAFVKVFCLLFLLSIFYHYFFSIFFGLSYKAIDNSYFYSKILLMSDFIFDFSPARTSDLEQYTVTFTLF